MTESALTEAYIRARLDAQARPPGSLGRIEDLTGYSPSDPRGSYVLRLAGTLGRLLD